MAVLTGTHIAMLLSRKRRTKMPKGMFVAYTGMDALEKKIDLIAQNVANVNSPGYKKSQPVFRMVTADAAGKAAAGTTAAGAVNPLDYLQFVKVEGTATDFAQGSMIRTGNPTDLAVEGKGFMQVDTPSGTRYTRAGSFQINNEGLLVTADGFPVSGQGGNITLKPGDFTVKEDGSVFQDGQSVGAVKLVGIPVPANLVKEGGGLYSYSGETSDAGDSRVVQEALENSNVNVVREMTDMISAMRAYESLQKFIKNSDEVSSQAINELGKL